MTRKYYDLIVNTYSYNQDEILKIALEKIGNRLGFSNVIPAEAGMTVT